MKTGIAQIDGSKTYILAFALLCYAIGGFVAGKIDMNVAIAEVIAALGLMGLRHGISKIE